MLKTKIRIACVVPSLLSTTLCIHAADAPKHPLDGLTTAEYWAVSDTLNASGRVDSRTHYSLITLHEWRANTQTGSKLQPGVRLFMMFWLQATIGFA